MENLSTFLIEKGKKMWQTYWLAFWLLVSFSAFMSPYGSVFGFGLFWFVLGYWIRSKADVKSQPKVKQQRLSKTLATNAKTKQRSSKTLATNLKKKSCTTSNIR